MGKIIINTYYKHIMFIIIVNNYSNFHPFFEQSIDVYIGSQFISTIYSFATMYTINLVVYNLKQKQRNTSEFNLYDDTKKYRVLIL